MKTWEHQFQKKIQESQLADDPAHDLAHLKRVVFTAKSIGQAERADLAIVVPAAWLHDFIVVPKNDPRRKLASQLSAQAARAYLETLDYPTQYLERISHAIEAHSFSAGITPVTLEAKIVQDADRLDALGAIGIARCFSVGGQLQRPFYHDLDPFAEDRPLDDSRYTLDHFYVKLFKLVDSLQTSAGKTEGEKRLSFMKSFLDQLKSEVRG